MKNDNRNLGSAPVLSLIVILGILLSIFFFWTEINTKNNQVRHKFAIAAEHELVIIESAIESAIESINSIIPLYQALPYRAEKEFNTFFAHPDRYKQGVIKTYWLPYIKSTDRGEFEQSNHNLASSFGIVEPTINGGTKRANERPYYFPALYIANNENIQHHIRGYDFTSHYTKRRIIEESWHNNKPTISNDFYVGDSMISSSNLTLLTPIYQHNKPIETPEDRKDNIAGMLVIILSIEKILEEIVAKSLIKISISDITDSNYPYQIYSYVPPPLC